MDNLIRIGTRGSQLALWQANYVAKLLQLHGAKTEIIVLNTKGDMILDKSLSKIGSKGVFTAELEEALLANEIDIAQHSAKDVQSQLSEGLELIAFTKREIVNDVLVSTNPKCTLNDKNLIIGTSSTRRVALLKHYYPHVETVDMRGNLQTRIRKLQEGQCDGLLLAFAGIHRMGYTNMISQRLEIKEFTPPVGQGTVAIECAVSLTKDKKEFIKKVLNDDATSTALTAERAFLFTLQGGCSIPSFALAQLNNDMIQMQAGIVSLNGDVIVKEELTGPKENAKQIGKNLAEFVLLKGGRQILDTIKVQQNLNILDNN